MTVTIKELTNHSYIDHELSATLDSSNAFEGPEKLLEIWFYPDPTNIPTSKTLRSIPVAQWVDILKLVKCEILSMKSTANLDAFLLSESSLFVYDHKLTLKTCGTTTTLFCLTKLFELVEEELGWSLKASGENNNDNDNNGRYFPYKVFYSRREFMFPLKQKSIHKNWNDEVEYLNQFFCHGKSYMVGRIDQRSHWNLYVTDTNVSLETRTVGGRRNSSSRCEETYNDETLEILMTKLDPLCAEQFVCNRTIKENHDPDESCNEEADDEGHLLGYNMTKKTGLDNVYHDGIKSKGLSFYHDAFAFSPCGYSSNMIIDEEYYYTLHVTPEKGWSYASFESNVPVHDVSSGKQDNVDVLLKVLEVFKPREFCLTFFTRNTLNSRSLLHLSSIMKQLGTYRKVDKIIYDLEDYQLLYMRFDMKE